MTLGRARINRMFRKSQQKAAAKFEYLALFDNAMAYSELAPVVEQYRRRGSKPIELEPGS